ncbi:MAG: tetratricopeptide repeat protein [Rhizobiaceae bacterium]
MPHRSGKLIATLMLASGVLASTLPARAAAEAKDPSIDSLAGAFLAARVAEADDDLGSAINYYMRALSFDPENEALQQSLMISLISNGQFDKALPYARKLKAVAHVERFSRLALAVDAFRSKKYGEAENWLKLALESDLDKLITGVMTAWAKEAQGDPAAALSYLKKLDGPDWYTLFVSYHRGLIADLANRKADAEAAYKATIDNAAAGAAAPDTYMRAAEAYARFLYRSGEKDKALSVLDKADQFAPDRLQIAALRKDIKAGATVAPMIADVNEGAAEILLDLGTALTRSGGEDFVRLYLEYALVLAPKSDALLLQLGVVADQQKNTEEAIAFFKRVSADSPMKHVAEMQIGLDLADLGRNDEAIEHLKKVLAGDPDDIKAYLALGGVYANKEDYRSAAELYDRAVARIGHPTAEDWTIFYRRGIAYERLKEWPKAEPNFKEALKLSPDQPQVLNYLGYSWIDMDINLEEGLKMIRKAVDQRPSDGYIVDSLGWAYYKLGRYQDALTELQRAVSLKPEDPVLNDHLGDALWRVGRKLEATYQWRHARDMHPDAETLASVQKKLAEGLPDKHVVVAQASGQAKVTATDEGKGPAETEKKADATPPVTKPANGETPAPKPEEKPAAGQETAPKAETKTPAPDAGKTPAEASEKGADQKGADQTGTKEEPKAEAPAKTTPEAETQAKQPAPMAPAEEKPADATPAAEPGKSADKQPAGNEPAESKAADKEAADKGGSAEENSYVVQSGQSLWSIAKEKFGNGVLYRNIIKENPRLRSHPNLIRPGQVLKLPQSAD